MLYYFVFNKLRLDHLASRSHSSTTPRIVLEIILRHTISQREKSNSNRLSSAARLGGGCGRRSNETGRNWFVDEELAPREAASWTVVVNLCDCLLCFSLFYLANILHLFCPLKLQLIFFICIILNMLH